MGPNFQFPLLQAFGESAQGAPFKAAALIAIPAALWALALTLACKTLRGRNG